MRERLSLSAASCSRGRALAAAGALAAVVLAATVILTTGLSGTSAGASKATKQSGAATVQRRDLVQSDTEAGTLSYANPRTVYNRMSGTITSLPVAGQVITPGGTLFRVDGAPVILMNGTVPAYRTLSAGVSYGADVQQLKQNLRDLGFDPGHTTTIDQSFDAATTATVERWQAAHGQTQTGTVTLGSVVFLPGPRRISAVQGSLGSTGGSGASSGASGSATTAAYGVSASHAEFVDLTTTSPRSATNRSRTPTPGSAGTSTGGSGRHAGSNTTTATLLALVALLRAEVAELRAAGRTGGSSAARTGSSSGGRASGSAPATGGSKSRSRSAGSSAAGAAAGTGSGAASSAASGSAGGGASAQAILQTTSTELVATVSLDATKQYEAVLGEPVTVQMPDGTTVDGRLSQVAAAATSTSSSGSSSAAGGSGGSSSAGGSGSGTTTSTVPVTITLHGRRRTRALDQAAVSVNFQQQQAKGVLSVPVTALLATAGGGYAIQEAAGSHRLLAVTPGLFAAGYVQISGPEIYPGLQVTDSQG